MTPRTVDETKRGRPPRSTAKRSKGSDGPAKRTTSSKVAKPAPKRSPRTAVGAAAGKAVGRSRREPLEQRAGAHPPLAYRLHALLHTMHAIAQHDDSMCTLLTEIERAGSVTPAVRRELTALLEELPGRVYLQELEAVREAMAPAPRARRAR